MSNEAKLLYALLLDRKSLSEKNGWRDENSQTYVIFTREEASEKLSIGIKKAVGVFKELNDARLITEKGKIGEAKIIYVNSSAEYCQNDKPSAEYCQNDKSTIVKKKRVPLSKRQGSNTEDNKTEYNKTDILSEYGQEEAFLDKIKDDAELYIWNDETYNLLDSLFDEIYYSDSMKVGNVYLPRDKLRHKLSLLTGDAVIYAVDSLRYAKEEIKNPRAFLKHALINAYENYAAQEIADSVL